MNKGLKSILSLSLALALVATVSACTGSNKQTDVTTKATEASTTTAGTTAAPEPEKLKILTYGQVDFEYNEKLPTLTEIENRTKIDIEWQNLPVGAEEQKLDLIFAGGDLPDMVIWSDLNKIAKLGSEGALIPLEDLVASDGPNITKVFAKMENEIQFFKQKIYALDGHLYNIPTFTPAGDNAAMTWAIREDWCKNVGLNVPTTTDELYTVLKAFREKDPNKNGKVDELPLVCRNADYYLLFLANSFGVEAGLFWDDKAQQVQYGCLDPRFKDALAYISKLYKEGLIDPEYITNTDDQFKAKINDNRAGMFLGYANSMIGASHDALKKTDASFNLVSMLPVAGPNGDRFKQDAYTRIQGRASITKDCKNPKTAMKLLDYCFSDEGHELLTYGIEGKTFVKVGDKYQILDYVSRNPEGLEPMQVVNSFGIDPSLPHEYDSNAYHSLSAPFVATIFENYASVPGILHESLSVNFTTEENDEMTKYDDLWKYTGPAISKFITGKEDVTASWDKFEEQVKKLGGEEIRAIYDKAYKRQFNIN